MKKIIFFLFMFLLTGCLSNVKEVRDCQEKSRATWGQCSLACVGKAQALSAQILCLGGCTIQHGGRFFFSCHKQEPKPVELPPGADVQLTKKQCVDNAWYRWELRNKTCGSQSSVKLCLGNSAKQLLFEKKRCGS